MNGHNKAAEKAAILLPELTEAVFLNRKNRFVGRVEVAGRPYDAHVPSSGRMKELLFPGNRVYVAAMPPGKKTGYRIHLAAFGGVLVSVDSLLPNRLINLALAGGILDQFAGYQEIKKEVGYGASRFDFYLSGAAGRCLMEVKSVTLVEEGVAKFPDAPSERGTKHLLELARAAAAGIRAAVIFVVQREDAAGFSPNQAADPPFARALRQAAAAGVEISALSCQVTRSTVRLQHYLPVQL
ncbi:DNA/RNA nuclease SfsA [Desulforamulus hydrothermalis]|uniref:Sugar fermentation stimulation protein homolog n=1 Tax=Desulforamulus hydrothermalis Lam5 = DSM 18033 TaxID=1121428 RepID=K8DY66_9FIRM|nr:putative regulator [Desulforamulus hydrothermalis Lam5 = DSM 18033]